jgi:rod shape-determining protein MreD
MALREGALMDGLKAALVLFVAALLQLSVLTEYRTFRTASIVLVALLSIALLRGSVFGAVAGFMTGLLLDTATLGTLGITSLLLTLGGFWIGRYGETTARDRFHAPYLSVGIVTIIYAFAAITLRFVLGDSTLAGQALTGLPAAVLLNLILTWPVYGLARRLFPPHALSDRVHEVRLLG